MNQEILDTISFYGKIIDDIYEKIKVYEDELKLTEDTGRIKVIKKFISGFKSTARHYKGEQKLLAFEN